MAAEFDWDALETEEAIFQEEVLDSSKREFRDEDELTSLLMAAERSDKFNSHKFARKRAALLEMTNHVMQQSDIDFKIRNVDARAMNIHAVPVVSVTPVPIVEYIKKIDPSEILGIAANAEKQDAESEGETGDATKFFRQRAPMVIFPDEQHCSVVTTTQYFELISKQGSEQSKCAAQAPHSPMDDSNYTAEQDEDAVFIWTNEKGDKTMNEQVRLLGPIIESSGSHARDVYSGDTVRQVGWMHMGNTSNKRYKSFDFQEYREFLGALQPGENVLMMRHIDHHKDTPPVQAKILNKTTKGQELILFLDDGTKFSLNNLSLNSCFLYTNEWSGFMYQKSMLVVDKDNTHCRNIAFFNLTHKDDFKLCYATMYDAIAMLQKPIVSLSQLGLVKNELDVALTSIVSKKTIRGIKAKYGDTASLKVKVKFKVKDGSIAKQHQKRYLLSKDIQAAMRRKQSVVNSGIDLGSVANEVLEFADQQVPFAVDMADFLANRKYRSKTWQLANDKNDKFTNDRMYKIEQHDHVDVDADNVVLRTVRKGVLGDVQISMGAGAMDVSAKAFDKFEPVQEYVISNQWIRGYQTYLKHYTRAQGMQSNSALLAHAQYLDLGERFNYKSKELRHQEDTDKYTKYQGDRDTQDDETKMLVHEFKDKYTPMPMNIEAPETIVYDHITSLFIMLNIKLDASQIKFARALTFANSTDINSDTARVYIIMCTIIVFAYHVHPEPISQLFDNIDIFKCKPFKEDGSDELVKILVEKMNDLRKAFPELGVVNVLQPGALLKTLQVLVIKYPYLYTMIHQHAKKQKQRCRAVVEHHKLFVGDWDSFRPYPYTTDPNSLIGNIHAQVRDVLYRNAYQNACCKHLVSDIDNFWGSVHVEKETKRRPRTVSTVSTVPSKRNLIRQTRRMMLPKLSSSRRLLPTNPVTQEKVDLLASNTKNDVKKVLFDVKTHKYDRNAIVNHNMDALFKCFQKENTHFPTFNLNTYQNVAERELAVEKGTVDVRLVELATMLRTLTNAFRLDMNQDIIKYNSFVQTIRTCVSSAIPGFIGQIANRYKQSHTHIDARKFLNIADRLKLREAWKLPEYVNMILRSTPEVLAVEMAQLGEFFGSLDLLFMPKIETYHSVFASCFVIFTALRKFVTSTANPALKQVRANIVTHIIALLNEYYNRSVTTVEEIKEEYERLREIRKMNAMTSAQNVPKEDIEAYRLLVQIGQTTWEQLGFTPPATDEEHTIDVDDYSARVTNDDQYGTADDAIIDEDAEEDD